MTITVDWDVKTSNEPNLKPRWTHKKDSCQFHDQANSKVQHYKGLDVTKPVFGVSHKVRFNSVCSATETSFEISLVANK